MKSDIPISILLFIIIGLLILIFLIAFYYHISLPIIGSINNYNNSTQSSLKQSSLEYYCSLISPEQILQNYLQNNNNQCSLINTTCNEIVYSSNGQSACYVCNTYLNCQNSPNPENINYYIDCQTQQVSSSGCV